MTFNLRYNEPKDGANAWPNRVEHAALVIREQNPLIVGTQEGYYDMLTDLEPKLPGYAWIGQGRFGGRDNEHCAIFYKEAELELLEQGQFWLSETPDEIASKSWGSMFPRVCTWARFRHVGTGKQLMAYNTHLDHYSHDARCRGAKVIWDVIRSHKFEHSLPIALLGDFNSAPDDVPIRFLRGDMEYEGRSTWLKDAFTALSGPIGLTAHSFKGGTEGEPIDYIFVSPDIEVLETMVVRRSVDGAFPSDHYPVVSRLQL